MPTTKEIIREETIRKIENPARKMLYPYTWGAKLAQFPYRWFWHNARIVRQMVWLSPFIGYGFYKIQSILNQDWNKQKWAEIRAKRINKWFEPVTE